MARKSDGATAWQIGANWRFESAATNRNKPENKSTERAETGDRIKEKGKKKRKEKEERKKEKMTATSQ